MTRKHTLLAGFALVILTMGGLMSAFQTMLTGWMTFDPNTNAAEWQVRYYVELAITLVLGICWLIDAIWLVREGFRIEDRQSVVLVVPS
jgi:hypothetical protein